MTALKQLPLLFVAMVLCVAASAQHYYFTHYKVESGLSNNSVFCSLQDHKGFVWFGTKDGLNRFDGHTFTVFKNNPDDPGSIGNNFILSLCEDKSGVLWAGSNNGLYRYDAATERFRLLPGTENNEIRDLEVDGDGNLWFIAGLGLHQYKSDRRSIVVYPPASFFEALALCSTPDGSLWVATTGGLVKKYDPAHHTFNSYNVFEHSRPAASRWIEEIFALNDSTLFVGTSNQGVKILHTRTAAYEDVLTYNPDKTEIFARDFIKNTDQEYWIATESGIFIYNTLTGKATHLKNQFGDPYSLSDNAVYTLCRDREGGIWAGTFFGGANYYPKQYNAFQKTYPTTSPYSLHGNAVREICQDRYGHLWIGTEDAGLNKLDTQTGRFTHFLPTGNRGSLSYTNVHGLLADGNELWIGTFEHGLDVLDIPSGRFIRHYTAGSDTNALKNNFIYDLYRTRSGDILIATARGLYRYNRRQNNFTLLPQFPAHLFYTKVLEDRNGTLWAGTYRSGVYFADPKTGRRGSFTYEASDKSSLCGNRINDLYEDSAGNLWLATENGFCRWVPAAGHFKRYTTKNGLPNNVVYGLLEDENSNLWISTSRGLVCFHTPDEKMVVYSKANGLLSDQFNYSSAYKDAAGRMYFGNTNGFISFQPSQFTRNTFTPPVYITGFQLNNQETVAGPEGSPLIRSILFTREIVLPHQQSSFSIDFAALSYTAPDRTEYAYKMEGLDGEWTYLKTNRRVYFTELAPGTYTFKVKAALFNGSWNGPETQVVIRILPPLWATAWAKTIYMLLVVALLVYGMRRYHKFSEERKAKEIYEAKFDFFTNVAHEIRTPLTLIKTPVDNLLELVDDLPDIKEDVATMERNTQRLMDLTTQILDFRQTEVKGFSIEFTRVNISQLLRDTYENFKLLARKRNLDYRMDLPPSDVYARADEEALTKIFSNLFSNAVKYAESQIHILLHPLQKGDTEFTLEIANDGYTIPAQMKEKIFEPFFRLKENTRQKGTGIGLALARSLAELHKGRLYLKDTPGGLNTFVLHLPLRTADHSEAERAKTTKPGTN